MLWILAGLACAPGKIETRHGHDELHTALFIPVPDEGDLEHLLLLLSNSKLRCRARALNFSESVDTGDTGLFDLLSRQELSQELSIALSRENSRVVLLDLWRFRQDDWSGYYPLISEPTPGGALDDLNARLSHGMYYGVNEAKTKDDDGLVRDYTVTELEFSVDVDTPGEVRIERASDDSLRGRFSLDAVDVSGSFKAERCDVAYENSVMAYIRDIAKLLDSGPANDF